MSRPLFDGRPKSEFLWSDDFPCSTRLRNCILRDDTIQTVADLRYTPDHVLRFMPDLGKVSFKELRSFIPYVDPTADQRSWWEKAMGVAP